MPAIQQRIASPPFEGLLPVFGAEFTFTAEPARTIEGIVRDAKTGDALAGASVESYKLVGYPTANYRALKATTDKQGRFRLVGMPKGKGNRLLVVPNEDQPHFMREVEVPDPDSTSMEMWTAIKRGIRQKADGTYRMVGLPGRAIVGAESVMKGYRVGVGYDEVDAPRLRRIRSYRNPINPSPKSPTMMRAIDPAADATNVSLDFELDPGASVRVSVIGPDGKPLTGFSVE